jgi:hypothetical protein
VILENTKLSPVGEYRTKNKKKDKIMHSIYKEDFPGAVFPRYLTELHRNVETNPGKKCGHQCPHEI